MRARALPERLLILAAVAAAVATAAPFLHLAHQAFTDPAGRPTLDNLRAAFEKGHVLGLFWNSILVTATSATLLVTFSAAAAFALRRMRGVALGLFRTLLVVGVAIPQEAILIPLFLTVRHLHLYDTRLGLVLPLAVSAFGTLFLETAFRAIPRELEDAARIDGASEWRIFVDVTLPCARGSVNALFGYAAIAAWGQFLWPLVALDSRDLYTLPVGLAELTSAFSANARHLAAGTVLSTLPVVLLLFVSGRGIDRAIAPGAVKE